MQVFKRIIFVIFLIFLFTIPSYATDRCHDYIPDVRQASIQYLGYQYPYWYNIGCMIAESQCRPNIISFDGGIGLFQFTPSTGVTAELSKYISINPHNAQSSIRGQAFYISRIKNNHFSEKIAHVGKNKNVAKPSEFVDNCGYNISDYYRFYNGGYWFFYESKRPGKYACENRQMFKYCVRGGVYVGKGKNRRWLSFCEVNYSYPEKVSKYAQPYRTSNDGERFWFEK